jgi:tetratricopeptide (TPR) repeat protein
VYLFLAEADRALAHIREAEWLLLELRPDLIDPKRRLLKMASFAGMKSSIAIEQGRYVEANEYAVEVVRLSQESGEAMVMAGALETFAMARVRLGEYDQARDDLLRARDLGGEPPGYMRQNSQAYLLHQLADIDCQQGNLERATANCQESLMLAAQIPDYNIIAFNLGLAAGIAVKREQRLRAAKLAGAAQTLYTRQHRKPAHDEQLDTLLPGWREGPDRETIQQAFAAGQAMTGDQALSFALSDTDA